MIYVGIDVASENHEVAICDEQGEKLCKVFTIENNRKGYEALESTIVSYSKEMDYTDIEIGLESTGHYSDNILSFLIKKRLSVKGFNPLAVNLLRKSSTLRKTKTDKSDAMFLARMLVNDSSKPYKESVAQIAELKTLTRSRHRLVAEISEHKVQINRLVQIVFPEYIGFFSDLHGATSHAVLSEFPSAERIADANIVRLTNVLRNSSKHRFGREKSEKLRNLARKSIGNANRGQSFELQSHLRTVKFLNEELKQLEQTIKEIMLEIDSPIMTIKGIGFATGAAIVAEIGDINSFQNPSQLTAFAGIEPSQYQSGKYSASNTPMVKRGSKYLRYALLTAARTVSFHTPEFKEYRRKKLAEDKHFFVVMSHVAKKLLRLIFALLKNNDCYDPTKIRKPA